MTLRDIFVRETISGMGPHRPLVLVIAIHIRAQLALIEFIRSALDGARIMMSIASSYAGTDAERAASALEKAANAIALAHKFSARIDDSAQAARFRSEADRIAALIPLSVLLPERTNKERRGLARLVAK
jgi:hypothetical protein